MQTTRTRVIAAAALLLAALTGCGPQEKNAGPQWKNAEAERAISKLGGTVARDDNAEGKPIILLNFTDKPRNVTVVDADLKVLRELTDLRYLSLTGTQVTDEGLKELRELKNLQKLSLANTQVTDEGLKELKELKNLQELGLGGTKVTDEGLKELKGLKNLELLTLDKTQVTDKGLKELKEALPNCHIDKTRH
jgi:hypothetical protein